MFKCVLRGIPIERIWLIGLMVLSGFMLLVLHVYYTTNDMLEADVIGYDKVLHFLGGIFCGVFALWLVVPIKTLRDDAGVTLSIVVLTALIIGLGWEVCEYYFTVHGSDVLYVLYVLDTLTDVIADVCGAAVIGIGWTVCTANE